MIMQHVGRYLYNRSEMPSYGRVMQVMLDAKGKGLTIKQIAKDEQISRFYGQDPVRVEGKVAVTLRVLSFRSVVKDNGDKLFTIANVDDAKGIIAVGNEFTKGLEEKAASLEQFKGSASVIVNNKVNGEKKMATTKKVKVSRMYLNAETNEVCEFGPGRPSKAKLASECDLEGKLKDPAAFAALATVKVDADAEFKKLSKAEIVEMVKSLRSQVAQLTDMIAVNGDESEVLDLNAEETQEDGEIEQVIAE